MPQQTRRKTATVTRILLVEDDPLMAQSLVGLLEQDGYDVANVSTVAEAMQILRGSVFGVVIAEMAPPDGDGFDLLRHVRSSYPATPVILVTSYGTIGSAVEAIKSGAFDYLTKPLTHDEIRNAVVRATEAGVGHPPTRSPGSKGSCPLSQPEIIGQDYRVSKVLDMAYAVADSGTTVLITGESGTGKSLIARAIHAHSPRRDGPFVEVACGAIPDTLLESELFGHVRGAFTHAVNDKSGKFATADGGTIFLDEIATASPQLQVKLLRVLQERRFEPVGSDDTRQVDVRVILATNRDLWQEVEAGRFRQDLFYRIDVVNIELPPLRDRRGDIPLLADYFMERYQAEASKHVLGFLPETLRLMCDYHWPGNIRELENCVQRAVVLSKGPYLRPDDLPPAVARQAGETNHNRQPYGQATLREALSSHEKAIIATSLEANGGNRQATAEQLGINRTTLYKKMRRLGLMDFSPGRS